MDVPVKFGSGERATRAIITFAGEYNPGDQPPSSYCDWHDWADVQAKAGLKQKRCPVCCLWRFPQEKCCEQAKAKMEGEWWA